MEPNFTSLTPMQTQALGQNIQNANATPNLNQSWNYYFMKRKDGVIFKIAPHNVNYHLARGFEHTDGVLQYDDPSTQSQPGQVGTPQEQMAKATAKMAEAVEKLAEMNSGKEDKATAFDPLDEVMAKKKTTRVKKVEDNIETAEK